MPGYAGKEESNDYYCDDCVPRGCSCNYIDVRVLVGNETFEDYPPKDSVENIDYRWIVKDERWEELDKGKQIPCCEFWYDKGGWEK
jgi:hypothetical protein